MKENNNTQQKTIQERIDGATTGQGSPIDDAFKDGASLMLSLILEKLRSESLLCNEPDPVRTGFEWAEWIEKKAKE